MYLRLVRQGSSEVKSGLRAEFDVTCTRSSGSVNYLFRESYAPEFDLLLPRHAFVYQ